MSDEIVISDVADASYIVQEADLIPAVKSPSGDPVSVKAGQLGVFVPIGSILLASDTNTFNFNIPSDVKLLKFEGILAAEGASAILSAIRFNNDSGANYDYTLHHFTGTESGAANVAQNEIAFSSAWSSDEHAIVEMTIEVEPFASNRHAFKSSTFNSGGAGDFHLCGGFYDAAGRITSIQFVTIAPFANNFAAGSYFNISALR